MSVDYFSVSINNDELGLHKESLFENKTTLRRMKTEAESKDSLNLPFYDEPYQNSKYNAIFQIVINTIDN